MEGEVRRGYDLMHVSDPDLAQITKNTTLFTRMFPESKLRVVNMLKKEGEIVAMLGDGVNDAPALKAAHIGVAMGHKGTEKIGRASCRERVNSTHGRVPQK